MPDLRSTVRAAISAHQMLASDAPVVVAVSGGPDSLCLLHVLRALYPAAPRLHVAHLDHMIRGAESAAEAQFVADLARAWGVPATVAAKDVPQGKVLVQLAEEGMPDANAWPSEPPKVSETYTEDVFGFLDVP
ncbi:MAG TPA: ATP-binding protein, partial [Kouleothrix sp.]|nr:ATP-binding protein [Kouleothrix sp.]